MAKALEGIRVIDLGHVLAAPTAAMILADMGADVIHVEPPGGDDSRQFGPFIGGQSAYFVSVNRNKKGLAIDLKRQAGKEILRDLVRVSDVVLENFRPTTMSELDFSYEAMCAINPKIIYAAISGFGHDALADYASKPAYDMVAQAYSGLMSICGPEGGPPVRVGTSVGDIVAGHQCAIGILSALFYRQRTGKGQIVDQSMVDGLVYILENAIVRYTVTDTVPQPLGTKHPSITPFQAFETNDGWIVTPIGNDNLWHRFCAAIQRDQLAADVRFLTNHLRTKNRSELVAVLERVMKSRSTAQWMAVFEQHGLPYSPINTVDKIVEDPNILHRQMIAEIDQVPGQSLKIAGSPFHLSETPGSVYRRAPLHGEHTQEILIDVLGYTAARVHELVEARVVFTPKPDSAT